MSEENRLTGENEQPGENELTGEIRDIFRLFFDEEPVSAKVIETGRGEEDFRNAVILGTAEGNRYVLKITANDFTNDERIRVWKRTIEEYRALGYYPRSRTGAASVSPTRRSSRSTRWWRTARPWMRTGKMRIAIRILRICGR